MWALFEPLPAGTKVDIQIPQMFPFESVPVTEGPPTFLSDEVLLAVGGVAMNLVSAQRIDQQVKLYLKLSSVPQDAARGETIYYQDVFLFDPKGRRAHPLMRDTEGNLSGAAGTRQESRRPVVPGESRADCVDEHDGSLRWRHFRI